MKTPEPDVRQVQAKFSGLERGEWWRWAMALLIILVAAFGVFSLSLGMDGNALEQFRVRAAGKGLLALVLIFAAVVVYQQIAISRLRRHLAAHIGMIATLNVLKPLTYTDEGRYKQRRVQRSDFNEFIMVKRNPADKKPICGRARDISECGLGAVIAEPLEIGDSVVIEFGLAKNGPRLSLSAIVRHHHGFHYGFEFVGVSADDVEAIKTITNQLAAE